MLLQLFVSYHFRIRVDKMRDIIWMINIYCYKNLDRHKYVSKMVVKYGCRMARIYFFSKMSKNKLTGNSYQIGIVSTSFTKRSHVMQGRLKIYRNCIFCFFRCLHHYFYLIIFYLTNLITLNYFFIFLHAWNYDRKLFGVCFQSVFEKRVKNIVEKPVGRRLQIIKSAIRWRTAWWRNEQRQHRFTTYFQPKM